MPKLRYEYTFDQQGRRRPTGGAGDGGEAEEGALGVLVAEGGDLHGHGTETRQDTVKRQRGEGDRPDTAKRHQGRDE
jgi:hypothetical protein